MQLCPAATPTKQHTTAGARGVPQAAPQLPWRGGGPTWDRLRIPASHSLNSRSMRCSSGRLSSCGHRREVRAGEPPRADEEAQSGTRFHSRSRQPGGGIGSSRRGANTRAATSPASAAACARLAPPPSAHPQAQPVCGCQHRLQLICINGVRIRHAVPPHSQDVRRLALKLPARLDEAAQGRGQGGGGGGVKRGAHAGGRAGRSRRQVGTPRRACSFASS